MTSQLRRKRPTTARARNLLLPKAASLAVFGLLLCGGFASAQNLGKPVAAPVSAAVVPAVHVADAGAPSGIQQTGGPAPAIWTGDGLQRTAYQLRAPGAE